MSRKSAVASGFSHKVLVWSVARSAIVRQEDRCFLGTEQVELGGGGAGAVKVFGSLTLRAPMVSFPFVRQDDFAQLDSRGTMQVKSVDWSANFMDVSFEISPADKKNGFPLARRVVDFSGVAPVVLAAREPGIIIRGGGESGRWLAVRQETYRIAVSDSPLSVADAAERTGEKAAAQLMAGNLNWFAWADMDSFFEMREPPPWWAAGAETLSSPLLDEQGQPLVEKKSREVIYGRR